MFLPGGGGDKEQGNQYHAIQFNIKHITRNICGTMDCVQTWVNKIWVFTNLPRRKLQKVLHNEVIFVKI
jgi:hypothetical protein